MTLNIFCPFFFPSSFTIHKIYSVKGCYKLLLPPAVPWPGGFLCPGLMDMAASCPFAGSTSSKAKAHAKATPRPCHREGTHTQRPAQRFQDSRKHREPCPHLLLGWQSQEVTPLGAHLTPSHPQVPSSPSPVLTANRHPPIPQASHTCRCPQIPTHTWGPSRPDTPDHTWYPCPDPGPPTGCWVQLGVLWQIHAKTLFGGGTDTRRPHSRHQAHGLWAVVPLKPPALSPSSWCLQ